MAKISIVIPAFNEEENIGLVINSIYSRQSPSDIEVIVVDNGSTDNTPNIVAHSSARLIKFAEGQTIASVRNRGVQESSHEILIFLDADIVLTEEWHDHIDELKHQLNNNPNIVTGSRCLAIDQEHWLNRYWFNLLNQYSSPYINSGHLITTRQLFNRIGGFSEHLQTAEDYDFCVKAKHAGAQIIENKNLPVVHNGYPLTILEFIKRERWHGKEDFRSWKNIKESKMAWIATLFLLGFVMTVLASLTTSRFEYFVIGGGGIYLMAMFLSLYKFGKLGIWTLLNTASIFCFYLIGRVLAIFDRLGEVVHIRS